MFSLKINKREIGEESSLKIFGKNITDYIKTKFRNESIVIISDSKQSEIIASSPTDDSGELSTIELTFKKTIVLNSKDLENKNLLDRALSEIRDFCDQSAKINNYEYRLITMRGQKDDVDRTSTTGNSKQ